MVFIDNQFDNIVNTEAHIKTREEIWGQTAGSVDGLFVL